MTQHVHNGLVLIARDTNPRNRSGKNRSSIVLNRGGKVAGRLQFTDAENLLRRLPELIALANSHPIARSNVDTVPVELL